MFWQESSRFNGDARIFSSALHVLNKLCMYLCVQIRNTRPIYVFLSWATFFYLVRDQHQLAACVVLSYKFHFTYLILNISFLI